MISPPSDVYRIFLMRHAHAGPPKPGSGDFDRELDSRGRNEVKVVVRQCEAFGVAPEIIISSAATRCRQTAAAFADILPNVDQESTETLYNASVDAYLDIIKSHSHRTSLLIVGHNPVMEELSEIMIGREAMATAFPYGFPTTGLLAATIARPFMPGMRPMGKPSFLITPSFSEAF